MVFAAIREGCRVTHKEYGAGTVVYVFNFSRVQEQRRSRYPYLVEFDSGHRDQFTNGEIMLITESEK